MPCRAPSIAPIACGPPGVPRLALALFFLLCMLAWMFMPQHKLILHQATLPSARRRTPPVNLAPKSLDGLTFHPQPTPKCSLVLAAYVLALVLCSTHLDSAAQHLSLSLQGISIQPTACDKVLSVGCALLVSATGVLWVCGLGGPQMASLSVSPFTTRVAQLVDQRIFGPRMYARAARRLLCYHACLCAPFLEWPQCNPEELEASHMLHHSSWRPRAAVCISSQHPTSLQHCNFPLPQGEFKTPVLFSAPNLLKLLLSQAQVCRLQQHNGK